MPRPLLSLFLTAYLTFGLLLSIGLDARAADDAVFESKTIHLAIAPDSTVTQLSEGGMEGKGKNWIAKERPLATLKVGEQAIPSNRFSLKGGDVWQIGFHKSPVEIDVKITTETEGIIFEFVTSRGGDFDSVRLIELALTIKEKSGSHLSVLSNEDHAVALLGLSDAVETNSHRDGFLSASFHREYGLDGHRVLLMSAAPKGFFDAMRRIELAYDLPSPELGGEWAKTSRDGRLSYLFTDLTEANVDETIRYAKLGGFGYILIYSSTWSRSKGSYPIHPKYYPSGEAGLKAVVDRCHDAGLKVGIHMLTSFVDKSDPLATPVPDRRLLKNGAAILATDIDETTTDLRATAPIRTFPVPPANFAKNPRGVDVQIDDEIIRYRLIGGENGDTLLECRRGQGGTKATAHKAGATMYHLAGGEGYYLVDLRTTLKDELSERIAGIINRCGLDMIYFDGGELNGANGAYWYWVSQQQHDICSRVTRPLRVQGSGLTPWTWHWAVRGVSDDFAAVATKEYLDFHKIPNYWRRYQASFLPAELGWWGFLTAKPHQAATTPDELALYGTRMVALDSPISMETNLTAMQENGRTEEMLRMLHDYEDVRLSDQMSPKIREALETGEWRLIPSSAPDKAPRFVPVQYQAKRADGQSELRMQNDFDAQPLKLRLQCIPTLAAVEDSANRLLFAPDRQVELAAPEKNSPMPGFLIERVEFAEADDDQPNPFMVSASEQVAGKVKGQRLDLTRRRALAVRLVVEPETEAIAAAMRENPAVVNVQLETSSKTYRDYDIDLDFIGERTVIIPEPTTDRILREFRPNGANYAFKAAMYGFDYERIAAVNFRWMRAPRPGLHCRVLGVVALLEHTIPLENPTISIGSESITFPVTLRLGDYLELLSPDRAKVYDKNGVTLAEIPLAGMTIPTVPKGEVAISLDSDSSGNGRVTLITEGN